MTLVGKSVKTCSIYLCAQQKLYTYSRDEKLFSFYFNYNSEGKFATYLSLREIYDYFYYPLFKNLNKSVYETHLKLPKRDIDEYGDDFKEYQPKLELPSVYYTLVFPNTDKVLKFFLEKIFFEHEIEYQWEYQINYFY